MAKKADPSPIPEPSGRTRNRVRMEITTERAQWLLGIITTALAGMTIADSEFQTAYEMYTSLQTQIDRLSK